MTFCDSQIESKHALNGLTPTAKTYGEIEGRPTFSSGGILRAVSYLLTVYLFTVSTNGTDLML